MQAKGKYKPLSDLTQEPEVAEEVLFDEVSCFILQSVIFGDECNLAVQWTEAQN